MDTSLCLSIEQTAFLTCHASCCQSPITSLFFPMFNSRANEIKLRWLGQGERIMKDIVFLYYITMDCVVTNELLKMGRAEALPVDDKLEAWGRPNILVTFLHQVADVFNVM